MHRKTRILLCRIGFVAVCVLPTTVIAGWIVSRGASSYSTAQKSEWERELGNRLGLIVELAGVEYPSPHVARLTGLKLLTPETRQPIGEAAFIEVTEAADGWNVELESLSLEASELPLLARTIDQRLLREQRSLSVRWRSGAAIVRSGDQGQTLSQVGGKLQCGAAGSQLDLQFRLAGQVGGEPSRLQARRTREAGPPATEWRLNTADQTLPCVLAAGTVPGLTRLGPNCEFRGAWQVVQAANGTSGELSGTLTRVDLDALVTEHFPHQLSGLATVTIERAALEHGKLTDFRGHIAAADGAISRSLIAAAQEHLGLKAGPGVEANEQTAEVPFDDLAVKFELTGPWLSLGSQEVSEHAVVLVGRQGIPLLAAPPQHAVTSANLLRTLLPDSRHQVPATQQTSALVQLLPLPDVAPPAAAKHPHTPTRLVPATESERAAVRQPVLR